MGVETLTVRRGKEGGTLCQPSLSICEEEWHARIGGVRGTQPVGKCWFDFKASGECGPVVWWWSGVELKMRYTSTSYCNDMVAESLYPVLVGRRPRGRLRRVDRCEGQRSAVAAGRE